MRIIFDEVPHAYFLEGTDKKFTSVTRFLETFTDPFDVEEQAAKFVNSKNNKLGLQTAEDVKAYWAYRTDLGSKLHAKREAADIADGAFTYAKNSLGQKICYTAEELKNLPPGVHTELTLHLMSAWLIGTADKVIIHEDKSVDIIDYKTNGEKLKTTPQKYFSKAKGYSDYKYFKHPISHVPCDTFQKYTYQLSAYAYFLEILGYTINSLTIIAIEMDDNGDEKAVRELPVEYRKEDIKAMINYFKTINK